MEVLLAGLEASGPATWLRMSRWGYAAASGAHVLGIALLVGAIIPLDLRLLGFWSGESRPGLVRVLVPVAAAGLALAALAGVLLFSVRAREYSGIGFLQVKLVLIAVGAISAITLHAAHGFLLKDASRQRLAAHALVSMTCWLGALACGRLIAFAGI
jgi:hypothetical protein